MAVLIVDDRDGRVVAELKTLEDAQQMLEAWLSDDGSFPDYLCLVELRSRHGAVLGTDSSVKVRPLPWPEE